MPPNETPVIQWLLEGDPAIRWQVRRDLLHSPVRIVGRERGQILRDR